MRLKNSAHFIGIIRGNFIELRDYDNIQDLKDGTKIIIFIFTPTLEEQKAFKKNHRNIRRPNSIQAAIRTAIRS